MVSWSVMRTRLQGDLQQSVHCIRSLPGECCVGCGTLTTSHLAPGTLAHLQRALSGVNLRWS